MHELVGRGPRAVRKEPAQLVDHAAGDVARDPHVAVERPNYVSFRFSVRAAQVPDLGVGPDIVDALQVRVLGLDEHMGVEGRVVGQQLPDHGVRGVVARGHAEVDGEFVFWVCLVEDRRQTLVEARLEAFCWSDDGYVRDFGGREVW